MMRARANYEAVYGKTLTASTPSIPVTKVPADGDGYTWKDTNNPVATNTATLESAGYFHYGCRDGHHFWLYGSGTTGGQPFVGTPCMCGQKKWGQTVHVYCPSPDGVIDYGQYTYYGDPNIADILQRLARLEAELAEMKQRYEGEL